MRRCVGIALVLIVGSASIAHAEAWSTSVYGEAGFSTDPPSVARSCPITVTRDPDTAWRKLSNPKIAAVDVARILVDGDHVNAVDRECLQGLRRGIRRALYETAGQARVMIFAKLRYSRTGAGDDLEDERDRGGTGRVVVWRRPRTPRMKQVAEFFFPLGSHQIDYNGAYTLDRVLDAIRRSSRIGMIEVECSADHHASSSPVAGGSVPASLVAFDRSRTVTGYLIQAGEIEPSRIRGISIPGPRYSRTRSGRSLRFCRVRIPSV